MTVALSEAGNPVADLSVQASSALLPGLRRIPLTTAQRLDGVETVSTNLVLARVRAVHLVPPPGANGSAGPEAPLRP